MTDQEINKALVLAIGWPEHAIRVGYFGETVWVCADFATLSPLAEWRKFDYREWATIGPIAERYSAFPSSISGGNFRKAKKQGYTDVVSWEVSMFDYKNCTEKNGTWKYTFANTPQKAIALAVIGTKGATDA